MLTLQFVPYAEIEHLDSDERIQKLLSIVKGDKVVLMQGRLRPEEETLLIQQTMQEIAESFTGVEICTIYPEEKDLQFMHRIKKGIVKTLVGHRDGMTIIGPASIIKEIKRDFNKIQLLTVIPPDRLHKRKARRSVRRSSQNSRKSASRRRSVSRRKSRRR